MKNRRTISLPGVIPQSVRNGRRVAGSNASQQSVFISAWEAERKGILRRTCEALAKDVASGHKLRPCARRRAAHFRKRYKASPSRRALLSAHTLIRVYYLWLRIGDKAFELRHRSRISPAAEKLFNEYLYFCVADGITSRGQAYRYLREWQHQEALFPDDEPFPHHATFERRLTMPQIHAIDRFHLAERQRAEAKRGLIKAFGRDA